MLLYFVLLKYLGKIYSSIHHWLSPHTKYSLLQTKGDDTVYSWLFFRIDPETRKYSASKIGLHPVLNLSTVGVWSIEGQSAKITRYTV